MPIDPAAFSRDILKFCHSENLLSQTLKAISDCISGKPVEFEAESIQDSRVCKDLRSLFIQHSDFSDWSSLYEHLLNGLDKKLFGRFYTPSDVCSLIGQLALFDRDKNLVEPSSVYDPTVGAGNLINGVLDHLKTQNKKIPLVIGSDISSSALSLFKSNMAINYGTEPMTDLVDFLICEPLLDSFDLTLINPPFSYKWDPFDSPYFPYGLAPRKASDWAFYSKILKLTSKRSVWISAQGVWTRMGQEGKIRREILKEGWLEAIIQLPENLFYNTSINVNLAVFDKSKFHSSYLVIDARKQYSRGTGRNKLTESDISNILDIYYSKEILNKENVTSYISDLQKTLEDPSCDIFCQRPEFKDKEAATPEMIRDLVKSCMKAFWFKAWYSDRCDREFCELFELNYEDLFQEVIKEFDEWRKKKEAESEDKFKFEYHLKFLIP